MVLGACSVVSEAVTGLCFNTLPFGLTCNVKFGTGSRNNCEVNNYTELPS